MAARVTSAHSTLAACPGTGGSWHELETRRTDVDRLYIIIMRICVHAYNAHRARPRAHIDLTHAHARGRARSLPRSGEKICMCRCAQVETSESLNLRS